MKQYIVDAFTDKVFSGNQAAVCVLDRWLEDALMLQIARENNFSETAFAVKQGNHYALRWFTLGGEIDLCGHATLGTAYILFRFYEKEENKIIFETKSGELIVERDGDFIQMDFPVYECKPIPVTDLMEEAFGVRPVEAYLDRDLLAVFDSEEQIIRMKPDGNLLKQLDGLCVGVTAKGTKADCVSRVFGPKINVEEDPVTGSTHCMIVPYWADKLKKNEIEAYQASERTGTLYCKLCGSRVKLAGKIALYAVGEILVDEH